jgi:hypothetical protein
MQDRVKPRVRGVKGYQSSGSSVANQLRSPAATLFSLALLATLAVRLLQFPIAFFPAGFTCDAIADILCTAHY